MREWTPERPFPGDFLKSGVAEPGRTDIPYPQLAVGRVTLRFAVFSDNVEQLRKKVRAGPLSQTNPVGTPAPAEMSMEPNPSSYCFRIQQRKDRIEPRTSYTIGRYSANELHPKPSFYFWIIVLESH